MPTQLTYSRMPPTEVGFYWFKADTWKRGAVVDVGRPCDRPNDPLSVIMGRSMMPLRELTGFRLWLWLDNGDGPKHEICLEEEVFEALCNFHQKITGE